MSHAPVSLSSAPKLSDLFPIPVFAHQGGWDEVLLVGIPLGLIGGLLWVANRRVNAQLEEANRSTQATQTTTKPGAEEPRSSTDP